MSNIGDGDDSYKVLVGDYGEFFDFMFFHEFKSVFDVVEGVDGD